MSFSANKRVWQVGGSLIVLGFGLKQWGWNVISGQVTEVRKQEHLKATKSLEEALEGSKRYSLPKLTQKEIESLKEK
jgi:hypothetical protein